MNSLCERQCIRCVLYEKYCGGCSLCEASICNKDCRSCHALCPTRPESIPFINSIGGPEVYLRKNKIIELPAHIPILPDRLKSVPDYNNMPVIAVHGGNMLSRNGEKINKSYLEKGYAAALNIDSRTKALVEFYVKDRTLEGFWDKRKSIYTDLIKMNFIGVIAPNFSVYEDAPRMDHIYNIKRTTQVYNEMIDVGINAIPDISWYNHRDLDRWCKEINESRVKIISFSFQVVDVKLKAASIWKSYLLGFRYLCQNIDPGIKIIIAGIASPRRIKEIYKASCGQFIHILNQSAYVQSRRGMLSENRVRDVITPFDEILHKNVAYFNRAYNEISSCYGDRGILNAKIKRK